MPDLPKIDIRPDHWEIVRSILEKHVSQYDVWAFGSRAKWTAKEYSDLDLAVISDKPLPLKVSASLCDDFMESDLPWKVDVVDWATTSESFKKIIERDKVVVQKAEKSCAMGEWNEVELSRIAKLRSGYPFKSANWVDKGVPVIKIGNVKDGRIVADGCGYVSEELAETVPEWMTKEGDVLIAMTGYVGEVALVRRGQNFLINQRVGRFDFLDNSPVIPKFLFYYLRQQEVRSALETMARGSAQPNLSAQDAAHLRVPLLPIEQQRAIAHILGTLDDKIELNRRQSETLQEMARALFKAWFVDFEPVRAKQQGRWQRGQSLPGLPAHLYDLFPDQLVETESGEVPQGWEMRPVADFADIKGGKQLGKERIAETGQIPVFGGAGIMGYTDDYNAEGFVISVGRVGAYCGQFFRHRGKAWINNNASLIKQKEDYLGEWLFLALLHTDIEVIKKGAAQPFVSNGDVAKLLLLWPQEQAIRAFSEIIVPLICKQEGLEAETKQLAALRDTLLPKLISGELRVPNAERILGEEEKA